MNRVFIKTYGCQMNERDSEAVAAMLRNRGYSIVASEDEADVILLNTCSVRDQAEQKALGKAALLLHPRRRRAASLQGERGAGSGERGDNARDEGQRDKGKGQRAESAATPPVTALIPLPSSLIPSAALPPRSPLPAPRSPRKIIGIMGCMAQNRGAALLDQLPDLDLVVGTQKFHQVPDHLDNLLASLRGLGPRPSTIVDIAEERGSQNALRGHDPQPRVCAFVSIMQGCDMRCSYCIVPKTRGAERARPMEDIVEETRELVAGGAREVTLLGQIVNHYGRREYPVAAGKTPFVQLLEKLHDIAGLERIRFTSPHPVGFRADLVRCYRDLPKLCEYVHLPAQSGSDRILRAMRRPHTRARYLEIVAALRDAAPGICISTDVIVGFPGETEEDFEQTVSLFDTVRFDMAYVFKYSTRTGTEAEAFGDTVPPAVKDERDKRLLALLEQYSLARNRSLVGSTQEILVEGPARKGDGVLMGRTRTNRKALFRGDLSLAGRLLPVHITGASVTTVTGEIAPPAEAPAAPAPVAQ